jgi:hypothetical protein
MLHALRRDREISKVYKIIQTALTFNATRTQFAEMSTVRPSGNLPGLNHLQMFGKMNWDSFTGGII